MSAFQQTQKYVEIMIKEVLPWLEACHREVQAIDLDYTSQDAAYTLQTLGGDYLMDRFNGTQYLAEFKAEGKHTENLFLETWSNKPHRPGWLLKNHADRLFYYFCDLHKLYVIDFPRLKRWAFADNRIESFLEVEQGKYEQQNKTCGRLVWIPTLFDELPEGAIRHFAKVDGRYKQVELSDDEWWTSSTNYQKWLKRNQVEEVDFSEIPF